MRPASRAIVIVLFLTAVVFTSPANARRRGRGMPTVGVGLVSGDISGLSLKYWLNTSVAAHGILGTGEDDRVRAMAVGAHFLPAKKLVRVGRAYIGLHVGGDVVLDSVKTIRGIAGFTLWFTRQPIEAFIEVTPRVYTLGGSTEDGDKPREKKGGKKDKDKDKDKGKDKGAHQSRNSGLKLGTIGIGARFFF